MEDDLIVDEDQHRIEMDNFVIYIRPVANFSNEQTGLLMITRQKNQDNTRNRGFHGGVNLLH